MFRHDLEDCDIAVNADDVEDVANISYTTKLVNDTTSMVLKWEDPCDLHIDLIRDLLFGMYVDCELWSDDECREYLMSLERKPCILIGGWKEA